MDKPPFGEYIRHLRVKHGKYQNMRDLSIQSRIDVGRIGKMEDGRVHAPQEGELFDLLTGLNLYMDSPEWRKAEELAAADQQREILPYTEEELDAMMPHPLLVRKENGEPLSAEDFKNLRELLRNG